MAGFEEKVKSLIEQRVIEATKKQVTQKLLRIAKNLGRPIVAQSVFGDVLKDPWELEEDLIYDPMQIHEAENWSISERGFHFDGLKCGINLGITSLYYENKVVELKATYNGYLVFAEMDGDLKAYAPFKVWEDAVNMFNEAAVQAESKRTAEDKSKRQEEGRKKMNAFWGKFRQLWGF